ncbi:MAG: hypothetical protein HeimC3_32630 [Candidatus Heimdallarchaeota archaeon LC_3]|nr:MAG: hypothetical protein HeimC3_32630 [Candidatus Heimdallarchaeota archaeon LC_3]
MGQITFRITDQDLEFLEYVSEKTGQSKSIIYRNNTIEEFRNWKKQYLLGEYASGVIGLKKMCIIAHMTLTEGMLLIEQNRIEPPIPKKVDDYTSEISKTITPKELFKNGKVPRRESQKLDKIRVDFDNSTHNFSSFDLRFSEYFFLILECLSQQLTKLIQGLHQNTGELEYHACQ